MSRYALASGAASAAEGFRTERPSRCEFVVAAFDPALSSPFASGQCLNLRGEIALRDFECRTSRHAFPSDAASASASVGLCAEPWSHCAFVVAIRVAFHAALSSHPGAVFQIAFSNPPAI